MSLQLPQAILFDLDDTILAYDAVGENCWREVCRRFAPQLPGLGSGQLLVALEETRRWYWTDAERNRRGRFNFPLARREIVSAAFTQLGVDAPIVARELADAYTVLREEREETIAPFPGAIETLHKLCDEGVRLGLITNGRAETQRAKVDRFGLDSLFDSILIEGEFGTGKPDERVYLHSLEQLQASPSEAWMVGDNLESDVGAAQRVGIWGVWVDWARTGLPDQGPVQPDYIVHRISELVTKAEG